MGNLSPIWANTLYRVDSPINLVAVFLVSVIVGYILYGPWSRNPASASAMYFFVSTMAVQIAYTATQTLRAIPLTLALTPVLWLPVWALASLGLGVGISLRRQWRRHKQGK